MKRYRALPSALKLEQVPGTMAELVIDRRQDLGEHFAILERQFIGKSRFSFEFIKLIVLIRREIDLEHNYEQFKDSLDVEVEHLCSELDTRWLVSVLDTLADHGVHTEQLGALMVIGLINTLKLCETENLIKRDIEHDPDKLRKVKDNFPTLLWDGVTNYRIESGEMARVTFAKMDRILSDSPVLHRIFIEILERLKRHNNPFSRLASYNDTFWKK